MSVPVSVHRRSIPESGSALLAVLWIIALLSMLVAIGTVWLQLHYLPAPDLIQSLALIVPTALVALLVWQSVLTARKRFRESRFN